MADAPVTLHQKSVVNSLAKGFRILECFEAASPELTLTEIARRTALEVGTAFRLVNTLAMLGYLDRVPGTKRYRLTLKVLDLGFMAIGRAELRDVARPVLRSLVGEIAEAASIGVLDGPDVVYIERVHAGLARLGVDVRIGSRIPAYYTAIGHAILAHLPREELTRVLGLRPPVRLAPEIPTTIEEIEPRLAAVRRTGYALHEPTVVTNLLVLAAPILDPEGLPYGAVSVAAPPVRVETARFIERAAEPVLRAAAKLGQAMRIAGSATVPTARAAAAS